MNILVTGGTGYIGCHVAMSLLDAGHRVVLYDNLSNSDADVARVIASLAEREVPFVEGDIANEQLLRATIEQYGCSAVMHLAGLKAVGESVDTPLAYFTNNVCGSLALLRAMQQTGVRTLVFSSSATVYGEPNYLPLDEHHPTTATNPYGRTKLHIEEILHDLAQSSPDWQIVCLRYFNPVGAHASGRLGENPRGAPNNLMPYVAQTAAGLRERIAVYGSDYPTRDGTGERDYIHITDLATGHLTALDYALAHTGWEAINLGTGKPYSVLEMIAAFELACGRALPYNLMPRRAGDVASCYAAAEKARRLLGWHTKLGLEAMCASAWRWQQQLTRR